MISVATERTRTAAPEPGIYPGVPFAEYAAWGAINQTALKHARQSLAHVRHALTVVDDGPSEALVLGNATHTLALEGLDAFNSRYFTMPDVDRRTKEGKARYAEAVQQGQGKTLLSESQKALVFGMAKAVYQPPRARKLVGDVGQAETCIVWQDHATGLRCKMRMDRIVVGGLTPDVKTCRSAARADFRRAIADYGYAEQQAFYELGYEAAYGVLPKFCIIAVENEPPHGVAVYTIGEDTMAVARRRVRYWLDLVGQANKTGVWPSYPEQIEDIDAPEWWLKVADPHTPVTGEEF